MSEEKSFRKAAVGGFHRKDVIDYIEQLLIEQAEERKEKDALITALQDQIAGLESRLADRDYEQEAVSAVITGEDDPDTVLEKVDALLKSYLGAEAEDE